ncbi:unnamed protein product [Orchesella dallaii]|uniref:DDE Tnp4 domain-containing protein n=1 Tax=Orchesella dallaii TaxID=48710 RepID=A0ABP1Q9E4_9HEXA
MNHMVLHSAYYIYSNYIINRLSRARRCVENAFGILCSKWLCLGRTMFINPTRAQKVVAACCVLHNYLLKESSEGYCPTGFGDRMLEDGTIVEGFWRNNLPPDTCFEQGIQRQLSGRPSEVAKLVRKRICEYVNSEEGSVAWQNNNI